MTKLYSLTFLLLICALHASGQYITVWKTDNPGSSGGNQITIPATGTDYNISWQEVGIPENNGSVTASGNYTLEFPSPGVYQVSITPGSGTFTRIAFSPNTDNRKLLGVLQWGDIQWESMESAYAGCNNMVITATDIPNLQNVTSMQSMFASCWSLASVPGIANWDVSNVTNMQLMFVATRLFNDPIGNWNVSNVTNMASMFASAVFNQPIGSWTVSNVTNMAYMFNGAPNFNQPIESWDVSNVTDMNSMFYQAASFNQPLAGWNVGNVANMSSMFNQAAVFNQPIDSWDVSNVTTMVNMFARAISFNQPIGSWDVGQVTDMRQMFIGNSSFNQPIGSWDVGNVTNMNSMFYFAGVFNQPINDWNVSNVTDISYMFALAGAFNQPVNDWDLSKVTNLTSMFILAPSFNQPVNDWDVSHATNLAGVFYGATAFNQSLSKWTVSPGANMTSLLAGSGVNCANMALTLGGWAANPAMPDNITFGADGISYALPAAAALETLRTTKNWTITIGEGVECAALAVSLISFDAKSADGTVKLEWATASETDNDYFEVERSADMYTWNVAGKIQGAGTVNAVSNYTLTDYSPLGGISYYRLKIVDFAGKADYSNIRAVNIKTGPAPSIYPNPATSSITLSGKTGGYVEIYNLLGKQVGQKEIKAEKTVIPLNGLPEGAYLIKSDDGWNSKFIKN